MAEGFWIAMLIVAFVLVSVLAKVISYVRKSDRQWRQLDKSKLRPWDDEDDWQA